MLSFFEVLAATTPFFPFCFLAAALFFPGCLTAPFFFLTKSLPPTLAPLPAFPLPKRLLAGATTPFLTAFFLLLVAAIVVVGAMDVAANLRWRSRVGSELRLWSFSVETVSTLQRTRPRAHRS